MNKFRLINLADGIFAIVMTLLVIDLKIPQLMGMVSNHELSTALWGLTPVFASYLLSFAVLTTYWMAHHYIVSVYAKNIDRRLMFWNMPFLMAVSLIPFSAHLLGSYVTTPLAIWIYSGHIIVIGVMLLYLFRYTLNATSIKNPSTVTQKEIKLTYIRICIPVACALFTIYLSFINMKVAVYFLVFAVVFNLIPGVVHAIDKAIGDRVTTRAIPKNKEKPVRARPVQTRKTEVKGVWVAR
ncbi:MAG: TMEM175 family protein [Patescibacteria group bacterium]